MLSPPADDPLRYRTLPRRIAASLIDTVVLAPLLFTGYLPITWLLNEIGWMFLSAVMNLAVLAYFIVSHAKWGQTPGKRLTRVRVVSARDEGRIGWNAAIRRERPWLILTTLFIVHDLAWIAFVAKDGPLPVLGRMYWGLHVIQYLWLIADTGSPLFNAKRRSLHDYIGGTVVVRVDSPRPHAAGTAAATL